MSIFAIPSSAADNPGDQVRKAVEKSTLDQSGTRPFHLKASFAPSLERDRGTNRIGEIELWWISPTKWRRELRSPEFHQIAIQDGARHWEKSDNDYFPYWLNELVTAITRPVPFSMDVLSKRVKDAEARHLMGQTNIDWEATTGLDSEQANGRGGIALIDKTGLLLYTHGPGFGGLYHDFKDFHGRMIAWTVATGSTELTAKLSIVEDLGTISDNLFRTDSVGGEAQPLETIVLSDAELRQNLLPGTQFAWPAIKDGPLEGMVGADIVVDRTGII